jgi:hypothetical protein
MAWRGRYIISGAPFEGAAEGQVDSGSQVHFKSEGQDYVLLTAVPVTRSDTVWVRHDASYRPSEENLDVDGASGFIGSWRLEDLRKK